MCFPPHFSSRRVVTLNISRTLCSGNGVVFAIVAVEEEES